jgi:hypothetical protein
MHIQYYERVKKSIKKNETQLGIGPRILVRCSYHQATVHVQHVYAGPVPIIFFVSQFG